MVGTQQKNTMHINEEVFSRQCSLICVNLYENYLLILQVNYLYKAHLEFFQSLIWCIAARHHCPKESFRHLELRFKIAPFTSLKCLKLPENFSSL